MINFLLALVFCSCVTSCTNLAMYNNSHLFAHNSKCQEYGRGISGFSAENLTRRSSACHFGSILIWRLEFGQNSVPCKCGTEVSGFFAGHHPETTLGFHKPSIFLTMCLSPSSKPASENCSH